MSYRVASVVTSVRAGDLTFWSPSLVPRPAPIRARVDPSPLVLTSDDLPAPRCPSFTTLAWSCSRRRAAPSSSFSSLRGDTSSVLRPYTRVRPLSLTCIPSRPLPCVSDPSSWGSGMTGPLPLVGSKPIEPAAPCLPWAFLPSPMGKEQAGYPRRTPPRPSLGNGCSSRPSKSRGGTATLRPSWS